MQLLGPITDPNVVSYREMYIRSYKGGGGGVGVIGGVVGGVIGGVVVVVVGVGVSKLCNYVFLVFSRKKIITNVY